jgi:hypothetical protein
MIEYHQILNRWQMFSQQLREPKTELEYDELLAFADKLSSEYSIEREPMKGLFWLVAQYLHSWEQKHDTWAS